MSELRVTPPRARDRLYAVVTLLLGVLLFPVTAVVAPRRCREAACAWALRLRYPREELTGLQPAVLAAFTAARTAAFWRDGQLIGLTSGHRDPVAQQRLYLAEVVRSGSHESARMLVLPAAESRHVRGVALDVRPRAGAAWLEAHGAQYHLYRTYDNEWWHFEYRTEAPPERLPYPGAATVPLRRQTPNGAAYRSTPGPGGAPASGNAINASSGTSNAVLMPYRDAGTNPNRR